MENKINAIRIDKVPLDEKTLGFSREIVYRPGVEKIVLFPDSFTKEKYINAGYKATVPSSSAIMSDSGFFYPQFRSRGINCGMAVISLPLAKEEINQKSIERLLAELACSLPYYLNYKFRLPFLSGPYDLKKNELCSVFSKGARVVAEKLKISEENLFALEFNGTFGEENFDALKNGAIRLRNFFGRYFGGNHFFEIQEATDVKDDSLGIKEGQLVVMIHNAGESLEDAVSEELKEKYIRQNDFVVLDTRKETKEFRAFLAARNILMNYGYAYRLACFAIINDAVKKIFKKSKECRIILDKSHNHFMDEKIGGEQKIIYRHNAERLLPGEFAVLSGTFSHPSYIVKGGEGVEEGLFSIDHGLGKILEYNRKKDNNTGSRVVLYRMKKGLKARIFLSRSETPEIANEITDDYFKLMAGKNILVPVVKLRPLVNMKFN